MTNTFSANPYVGPRPFQPGERLYGRDQEIYDLLDLLIAERIVLLYSPSGAGKTSLIQAGLLPELVGEGFQTLPVMRVSLEPPLDVREELGEYNRYVLSLLLSLEEDVPEIRQIPLSELARMTFAEYLEQRNFCPLLEDREEGPSKIVLIFDQFEEILTVNPTDYNAKVEFFTQVGAALRHRDYWALISMREEFPARLDPYVRYVPTRLKNRFRLELLDAASAAAAIQEPVQDIGVTFTKTATTKLVDDLRRVRVQQPDGMIEELPGMYVEPVQLQVVCHRLWNQLPEGITEIQEEDIRDAGDVDTALAGYYAERVKDIAEQTGTSERTIREWFLHHLITEQGIRGQIVKESEETKGLSNEAVEQLVDAHLVRAEQRRGVTWYELAHDRLIEPVQLDNFDWLQEHLSTLQREAALWDLQERTSGLLLRDEALKEIEQWAVEHAEELTETEEEFLQACREEQVRVQRERLKSGFIRGLAIAATIVMCVAVFFYINSEFRRKEAERLSFVSLAQNLLNEAMRQKHDDLKLLLLRQAYLFNQKGRGTLLTQIDHLLRGEFGVPFFSRVRNFDDEVMSVAISADGQYLACGIGDGTIQVFDLTDSARPPFNLKGHQGPICALAFHPEGRFLASAGWDRTIRLWEPPFSNTTPVVLYGHARAVFSVAFSPDGNRLASGSWDTTVRLWDLRNLLQSAKILEGHKAGVNAVSFSPDGKLLASGGSDGTIRLWNMASLQASPEVLPLQQQERPSAPPSPSPSSERPPPLLPEGAGSRPARERSVLPGQSPPSTGEQPAFQPFRIEEVNAVAFSPDGTQLAVGTSGHKIWMWHMQNTQRMPVVLEGHHDRVLALAFSPDGQTLASGAGDREVRLWNLQDIQSAPEVLRGHDEMVFAVAFSPDGHLLVSGSDDETVRLWELQASETAAVVLPSPVDEITEQESEQQRPDMQNPKSSVEHADDSSDSQAIQAIAFSQDVQHLYALTQGGSIVTWEHTELVSESSFPNLRRKAFSFTFSQDGTQIAIGDDGGSVSLWSTDQSMLFPLEFMGHTGSVDAVALHPDGTLLASGGEDKTIRIWDLQAPQQVKLVLRGHEGTIRSLAFSPTQNVLASGGADNTIRLWNLQFPDYPPLTLTGHTEEVLAVAFSPDGTMLASASEDDSLRLWPLKNLRTDFVWLLQIYSASIRLFEGENPISSIAFSPDGTSLAVRSQDTIHVWNLDNLEAKPVILDEANSPLLSDTASQDKASQIVANAAPQPGMPPPPLRDEQLEQQGPIRQPLAFSPDGKVLASGHQDNSVILWTRTEVLVEDVCQRVWRNLSLEEWSQFVGANIPYEATCPTFR